MQGNSVDGLGNEELLRLLTNLTGKAQEIAAQCLAAAELLSETGLPAPATAPADADGELDLAAELASLGGTWAPETFPAEWLDQAS